MNITAQQVKELREKTGAPMMDCKNALTEANGDMAAAEVVLRKRGIAVAQKKAGRAAQEGLVEAAVRPDASLGAMLEINCESDFVARTDAFQGFLKTVTEMVTKEDPAHVDALLAANYPGASHSVREALGEMVGKLGENIVVRRFVRYSRNGDGWISTYSHHGKIGVMVEAATEGPATDLLKDALKDIAMHIAASDPRCISRDEVDPKLLAQEREIQAARARAEGKPEKIIEKMVEGRLGKFFEEICLLEQPFIRETNMSVAQWLASKSVEIGKVTIKRFARFKVGEGVVAVASESAGE
jgi:elongation factor Ts